MKQLENSITVNVSNVLEILSAVDGKEHFLKLKNKCFEIIESSCQQLIQKEQWKTFLETNTDTLKSWLLELQHGFVFFKSNFGFIQAPEKVEIKIHPFEKSFKTHAYSDVTLESKDGHVFEAHKVILSSKY